MSGIPFKDYLDAHRASTNEVSANLLMTMPEFDADGNRGSIVFTLEESLAERFGLGDLPIVRSLQFVEQQLPSDE